MMTLPMDELIDYYQKRYPVPGDELTAQEVANDAKTLADEVQRLQCELDALREQSANEHAAWEAFFTAGVSKVARSSRLEGGKFYAVNNRCRKYGNHPVDAVLAVVKAAKQDAGTEPAAATERTTKHG